MHICRFVNDHPADIQPMPAAMGNLSNPRLEDILSYGWREYVPSATPNICTSHWENDGRAVRQVVDSVWTEAELAQQAADAAAAQAAAEAAEAIAPRDVALGKAVLRTRADGSVELLSGPLIVPGTTNGAYEVWVDAETGLVLTVLDHASPRKSKAEKDAAKADKKAKIAAVKAAQTDKAKLDALLDLLGLK
jgi:hypothetical protein